MTWQIIISFFFVYNKNFYIRSSALRMSWNVSFSHLTVVTVRVFVEAPVLSPAALPQVCIAIWLPFPWVSSSSCQTRTTPSHSTAPPAGNCCSRSAAWNPCTRALRRMERRAGWGRGRVEVCVQNHLPPLYATNPPLCSHPAPPKWHAPPSGQSRALWTGTRRPLRLPSLF